MPDTLTELERGVLAKLRELKPYMRIEIKMVEDRVSVVSTSTLKEDYPL